QWHIFLTKSHHFHYENVHLKNSQGPALVLIPLILFAIVYALIYPHALFYLRRKIHGDEVDK
ncbi:MAG: hypothetical protein K6T91_09130, partial [Firmicutes bacterium]|nr:hypothetical protein [Bacillota bacterium]